VCTFDPFCCTDSWDVNCAAVANISCGTTGFDCEFPVEACTYTELEACGESINDGCNADIPLYETIGIGERVCGTFDADTETRDTDWYEFTLTQRSTVSWTVYSRVSVNALLIQVTACNVDAEGNDDLALVASGEVIGSCPSVATNCLDAGTYIAFVAPVVEGGLPCGTDDYNNYYGVLTAEPVALCPGDTPCPDFDQSVTQSSSLDVTLGTVGCPNTLDHSFARIFDSANSDIPATEFEISCVEFGVFNGGPTRPASVSIYLDPDGGTPDDPATMTLLGSTNFDLPAFSGGILYSATFDENVCVPANSAIVIDFTTASQDAEGNGSFAVGNDQPESAPSYYFAPGCNITAYTELDLLGLGELPQWSMSINISDSCGGSGPACPGDFNNDGFVDGADFGNILAAWGSCPGCAEDLDTDGVVGGSDVGLLLSVWGPCSP
jgi:hypothetical protein